MAIYVNRVLNMKHIKAIGFDMDHTLVRYHSDVFEELTFNETIKKLVGELQYPKEVEKFEFNFLSGRQRPSGRHGIWKYHQSQPL